MWSNSNISAIIPCLGQFLARLLYIFYIGAGLLQIWVPEGWIRACTVPLPCLSHPDCFLRVILLFYVSDRGKSKTCVCIHNTCGQAEVTCLYTQHLWSDRVHVTVKPIHIHYTGPVFLLRQAWTPQTYTHTPCITQYIYTRGQHSKKARFSHFCNHGDSTVTTPFMVFFGNLYGNRLLN